MQIIVAFTNIIKETGPNLPNVCIEYKETEHAYIEHATSQTFGCNGGVTCEDTFWSDEKKKSNFEFENGHL